MFALSEFELGAAGLGSFVVAMREVAMADGLEHPDELELINAMVSESPDYSGQEIPQVFDTASVSDPEVRTAFLTVLGLVAVVDGAVQQSEREVIQKYADALGASDQVEESIRRAILWLLSSFSGVEIFQEELLSFGEGLGLQRQEIIEFFASLPDDPGSNSGQ